MKPRRRAQKETVLHEEYTILLSLVGAQVGGVPATAEIEDYKTLILLARQHSVLNILYHALKDDPALPSEYRTVLEGRLFSSVQQQLEQERETARIRKALDEAGIRHLLMKGALIRALYPAPEMRTSCDVDFYYDKKARPQMDALFASLGYEKEEADPNHTAYKQGRVSVEMHHNLLTDIPRIDKYYADLWDRLIPLDGHGYAMRDEDFYIYHVVHTMKHFTVAGTGIRSVLDTFVFLRAKTELDMTYLRAELEKIGLWEFHLSLVALAEVWFGGGKMPADLADVSAYVLGSGTYGTTGNAVTNRAAAGRGGKLGFALRRAFPSYHFMAEKYPSLRRFPVALPFYWLYRILRALFGKDNRVGAELSAAQNADAALGEQLAGVMRRVGLDGYR